MHAQSDKDFISIVYEHEVWNGEMISVETKGNKMKGNIMALLCTLQYKKFHVFIQ